MGLCIHNSTGQIKASREKVNQYFWTFNDIKRALFSPQSRLGSAYNINPKNAPLLN
jgi:hypothetical protein